MDEISQQRERRTVRENIRDDIAAYFTGQAEWRRQRVAEYPEDDRNSRSADGLEELAAYVLSLDPMDGRLTEIGLRGWHDEVFFPKAGDSAEYAVARFRFHDPSESCEAFLLRLADLMREDDARSAATGEG